MLALSGVPLQTAGERAFFAELARWDTGGAVRGAVVASVPLLTGGPLQRRLSDAVLIVPEGIAVIRIAEVVRQSGVVTASPDGPWSIGPGDGPGEVLQLSGGGSTPLDGLMRAGMEAAVRLRQAGLEPGRIARLTVLVGDLTGLHPADGDLGEGDQVALLDSRSLMLGISRAARYTGVDNPRVWTTADVRAALEALGLQGRGPAVEELNGEGFAYSPYVLRRPELMAPSGVTAASTAAPAAVPVPVPAAAPQAAPVAAPVATPVAVGPAAGVPGPAAAPIAYPSVAYSSDTFGGGSGGAGGLGGGGVLGGGGIGGSTALVDEDTDGLGGLFASAEPVPEAASGWGSSSEPDHASAPPTLAGDFPDWMSTRPVDSDAAQPRRARRLLVVAAALAVLVLTVAGGVLMTTAGQAKSTPAAAPARAVETAAPTLAPGRTQNVAGVTYRLEGAASDATCIGHAYGQAAGFFSGTDCSGLSRAVYSARLDDRPVVVAISRVRMSSPAGARALRTLTDRNGTGNVNDLLREGVHYAGGPAALTKSQYVSEVNGSDVTIVETAWVTPNAGGRPERLDAAATSGLALEVPPLPAP